MTPARLLLLAALAAPAAAEAAAPDLSFRPDPRALRPADDPNRAPTDLARGPASSSAEGLAGSADLARGPASSSAGGLAFTPDELSRGPASSAEGLSFGPAELSRGPASSVKGLSFGPGREPAPAEQPGPPARTPALAAAGPDALPAAPGTPHTLYINFDGAVLRRGCGNDSRRDCSTLADLFDGYIGPFPGTEARRVAILESVRKDLKDIGVRTTWTRPPPEPGYTMVLYGDIGDQDFAGIAPYIDCGNLWPNDTCFAGSFQGSNTGATVILQEAAHTWGLEHVDSPFDNLHPFVDAAAPYFQDQCNKIVANTDLVETAGVCNLVHEKFCETGYQNSYRELLYLFGPSQPDITAPRLDITSPADGSFHVAPVDLQLLGEIVDDVDPQFYTIDVRQAGETLLSLEGFRLALGITRPPPGEYDLVVTVTDQAGNAGSDRVRFTILPPGSEDPDGPETTGDTGDTDAGGGLSSESTGCRVAAGPPSLALLALVGRRRRRR